jgi:hypothetical protein
MKWAWVILIIGLCLGMVSFNDEPEQAQMAWEYSLDQAELQE